MANNYDYIAMLNMDLSPPVSTEVDFQNDLDLWLNTDFIFADTSDNSSTFNQRLQAGNVLDAAAFAPTANVAQYEERQVNKQQVAPQYNPAGISEKPFLPELVPLASPASDVEVTASVQPTAPTAASAVNISPEQISQLLSVLQTPPITDTPATIATSGATEVAAAGQPRQKSDEELDKRRRNTAASARFRAKKKMREQQLEQTAKEMTDRCSVLERRVKEYEMELKWLRQLVTDRDGKKRLRDFYEESGVEFNPSTAAAGFGPETKNTPQPILPAISGTDANGNSNVNLAAAAAAFAGVMALAGNVNFGGANGQVPILPAEKKRKI